MYKNLFYLISGSLILTSCIITRGNDGKNGKSLASSAQEIKGFNKKLADSLGADKYGMKNYFLVILKTGENDSKITDKNKRSELFKGHFSNMKKLSDEGKLTIAGPFGDNNLQYRGIFIFNTKTKEETENFLKDDPTVREGIFDYEILPWYGSAALPMYLPFHTKIAEENP
ncbi:MAG: YciI family protein [Bergeyella sp.]